MATRTFRSRASAAEPPSTRSRIPARVGIPGAILAIFVLAAAVGPFLLPFDGVDTHLRDRLLAPGSGTSDGSIAWFGTDQLGRDLLAQVIAGARVSLVVALATVVVGGLAGLVLGLLAGYFGGWLDSVISRIGEMQLAFPSLLLAILLAGTLGPSMLNVIIALAVTRWVIFARVVRGSAVVTREREFVDSARVLGAGHLRIMVGYVLPACVQPLVIAATVQVGLTMVAESALSFLGLGIGVDQASWGATIANGRDYLASAWWIATIPGIALTGVVISVGLLGDALRDVQDPHRKVTR